MSEHRELTSWKEIADYLKVAVRTAQLWEKERAMPVHRVGGRGRVFAFPEELDAWKVALPVETPVEPAIDLPEPIQLRTTPSVDVVAAPASQVDLSPRVKKIVAVSLLLAGCLIAAFLLITSQPGPPVQWDVFQSSLVVRDESGRKVWQAEFENLDSDAYLADAATVTRAWLEDLDGDGTIETLFVQRPVNGSDVLWCFNQDGTERWRFTPGRTLSTAKESLANLYQIATFKVTRFRKDGPIRILAPSYQVPNFPSQIAVLSTDDGRVLREYWHPGHLGVRDQNLAVWDLDQDGASEIYLGGINNARRQATLVVLDPETMEGAAAETDPNYQFAGFAPGRERARLFFPRSCINLIADPYNSVHSLHLQDGSLRVDTLESFTVPGGPVVLYEFSSVLNLKALQFSDTFAGHHDHLQRDGTFHHGLKEDGDRLSTLVREPAEP